MSLKILTDVPQNKVQTVTNICMTAGAISVTPTQQANGAFTLVIVYPDAKALTAGLASPNGGAEEVRG
jgi:hypothetical protein